MRRRFRGALLVLAAAAWLAAAAAIGSAQCPMCRQAAAAQPPQAARMFNLAIVVMFVPALVMFSGVILLSFRYRYSPPSEDRRRVEEPAHGSPGPDGRDPDE